MNDHQNQPLVVLKGHIPVEFAHVPFSPNGNSTLSNRGEIHEIFWQIASQKEQQQKSIKKKKSLDEIQFNVCLSTIKLLLRIVQIFFILPKRCLMLRILKRAARRQLV